MKNATRKFIGLMIFQVVICVFFKIAAASEQCDTCHQLEAASFNMTAHSTGQTCEICHGSPDKHLTEQEKSANIFNPESLSARRANATCLNCHDEKSVGVSERFRSLPNMHGNMRCYECHKAHLNTKDNPTGLDLFKKDMSVDCSLCHQQRAREFEDSGHGRAAIKCSDCHELHKTETISQDIESEIEKCISCHPNTELEFKQPHNHPLRERQVRCSSCHNPHSSRYESMLKKDKDKTCGQCHADIIIKSGKHPESKNTNHPFGVVGCMDCHNPHGANFDKVLKHDASTICVTCHK